MTRPNRHRVQRQIVELAVGASAEATAVHRELARPFWDRAVPELERVFDGVAGPDELLRLDRLEIDLGRVDGVDWTTEFRRKLIAELTRSLAQLTVASRARDGGARADSQPAEPWRQFVFFLIHGYLPWWGAKPDGGWTDVLPKSSDAAGWSALREAVLSHPHARARLVHSVGDDFLETAIVHWSGLRHAARVLEQLTPKGLRGGVHRQWRRGFWSLVIDWVSAGGFRSSRGGPELVHDLLTLRHLYVSDSEQGAPPRSLSGGDSKPERLNRRAPDDALPDPWHDWQMSPGDASIQRAAVGTQPDDVLPDPWHDWQMSPGDASIQRAAVETQPDDALPDPWHDWQMSPGDAPIQREAVETQADDALPDPWHDWQMSPDDASIQRAAVETQPDDALPDPWHDWQMSPGDASIQRAAVETQPDAGTMLQRAPSWSPSRERAPADNVGQRPVQDEALYLEGAGAILLHPFFEQLFRARGLLAGCNFRDDDAGDRAVRLLGLLTFGSVDVPEYELVLAKLLCGVRFEEPLEPMELENDDLVACDELLRAVLEHWTALRSSSPEWLRQQFFLREGKLERAGSGYLLTIERRAQDVLLTRLPWACDVVALPWLAERIFVRWLD